MLLRILSSIINHPLNKKAPLRAIGRFIRWQLASRIVRLPVIFPYAEKSALIMKRGQRVATGNYYNGLFEFEEMAFVLHYLKEGDSFIDVGANIGSFTILAANEVGVDTVAIEPIPSTYRNLLENIRINGVESAVRALNIGLGSQEGTLKFTNDHSAINHVVRADTPGAIDVQVKKFDSVIDIVKHSLVKIDVEGFEIEVLKGMTVALSNPNLQTILIETNNSGKRYGVGNEDIHSFLVDRGFQPFLYDPWHRALIAFDPTVHSSNKNTVYTKNKGDCEFRVKAARKFTIHGEEF